MSWRKRLRAWMPNRRQLLKSRWTRWLRPWLGHPSLWRWNRHGVALGVAIGVFFGLLIPIAQIPATAVVAIALRANIPAAAASTLISNPVTFGPIYYVAWRVGVVLTGEHEAPQPTPEQAQATVADEKRSWWDRIADLGRPLLVGLSLMAVLGGVLTYFSVSLLWHWRERVQARRLAAAQAAQALQAATAASAEAAAATVAATAVRAAQPGSGSPSA